MSASTFRINQPPGSGYTYWDRARRDLSLGLVECEAQSTSESSYLWEIISAPPGESITITNPTSSTCSFTIATRYGYLIRLTVNDGEVDESQTTLYFGVALEKTGDCLPAFNETNQDNSQSPYTGERGFEDKVNTLFTHFDDELLWTYNSGDDFIDPISGTSVVKTGDGTVSNPGFGFSSDVDTGIYLPSAGVLSHVAGGAEILRTYLSTGDAVIESQGGAALILQNADAGGTIETNVYSDTTGSAGGTSDVNIRAKGAGASTLNLVGETTSGDAIVNLEASGTDASSFVNIGGDHCSITFTDYHRAASTFSAAIPLASSSTEWNDFETAFGEVSVLASVVAAKLLSYDGGSDFLRPIASTTVLKAGDGTVSNPGYGFISDVDTGIYLPSAGVLSHVAGGTEVFRTYLSTGDAVIESQGGAALILQNADAGGTIETNVYSDTTGSAGGTSDVNIRAKGAGASTLNLVGETTSGAAIVNLEASGTDASSFVNIGGDHCSITFTDYHRAASTFSAAIPLASSSTEWNDFETAFGEVSLLSAITSASSGSVTLQGAYDSGQSIAISTNPVAISGNDKDLLKLSYASNDGLVVRAGVDDGVRFGIGGDDGYGNHNLIITSSGYIDKDHGLSTLSGDPSLFIFSNDDPSVTTNRYLRFYANASYAYHSIGSGLTGHIFQGQTRFNDALNFRSSGAATTSGVQTIDFTAGNVFTETVDQNITSHSITAPPTFGYRGFIVYTSTGSYSVDGFSGWLWDGSSPPFAMTNGDVLIVDVTYTNSTYYARVSGVYS